ncbi:SRPBCC family protein [Phaeobacter sp. HF9A]|uniref:SRPBCC family protein n=1 Tax=Phaeobacter sp. HF9A TaxID=2721561 RepID=UPI001431B74A|nr:SRPBCC family protein [Phaeobacter sp. HF9A]NIZ14156.1 SRPBCC family protein [Phaeobacter sp. HF9A]
MHFETQEDIDRPIADVFAAVTDFDSFERAAIRRGVDVQRIGDATTPLDAQAWDAGFQFRGSARKMQIKIQSLNAPDAITYGAAGNGMVGDMALTLQEIAPNRTRMMVQLTLKPKTLAARLLVQSLKLARNKLNRKFRQKVSEFARNAEAQPVQSA